MCGSLRRHPEFYRLATMGEWRSGSNVDIALDSSAFKHMRASVQTLMDEGVYRTDDPTTIALELWSVMHGVAALAGRQAAPAVR